MIKIGKLNNGIKIVNDYINEVETTSIKIIVKTGSRNETIENNGISHFIEHMAFKGTTTRTAKQIACDFENIGASFNAYTSKDTTAYYSKQLKEYTEKAFEILVDMVDNSIFSEEELERERGVILQELAMTLDTPDNITVSYPYRLWSVMCTDMHGLLADLRLCGHVRSSSSFGACYHVTMYAEVSADMLREYLVKKGYTDVQIIEISPTVEDCFMLMLREEQV